MALSWLQLGILAVVQGFAGILPLSDSGFFAIARHMLGASPEDASLYATLLRVPTLLAILVVYRKDFAVCLGTIGAKQRTIPREQTERRLHRRLLLLMLLSALPMIPALLICNASPKQNLLSLSGLLILGGFVSFLGDRVSQGRRKLPDATAADSFAVGLAQALSVVPGFSRTALTMTAGIIRGLDPTFNVMFSFFAAIPALLLQTCVEWVRRPLGATFHPAYLAGMVAAFFCSCAALRLLRFLARRGGAGDFPYVVWGAGALAFILYLLS